MINKREAFSFGLSAFKKNWGPFVTIAIFVVLFEILGFVLHKKNPFFGISDVVTLVGGAIAELGFTTLSLKVIDGKRVNFSDIFTNRKLLIPFSLVFISYSLLIRIGFMLFVIPGIILGARLFSAPYLVVDKNLSYKEAFKTSWKLTRGKTIKLILFQLSILAVIILGLLTLGVGILISIPVIEIASVYVYKKLTS